MGFTTDWIRTSILHRHHGTMCLEHILDLVKKKKKTHLPAAKGGLQQSGEARTKENGANQLTGCPLVKSHTHGLGK